MNEFVMATRALYKNMLKVEKSVVWEPELEGGPRLWDPQGIPANFTDCGAWIKVSGDAGVFEMRKPKKNDNERNTHRRDDEDELIDPEVYFQCCISCDVDPDWLVEPMPDGSEEENDHLPVTQAQESGQVRMAMFRRR